MSREMKVAIYARVSTAEQSSAMQLEELREYCHRRHWKVAEEFVDEGVSGSKESRPALNRLLADAKRRKFDGVLVYRFDRFARSMKQLVNALSDFNTLGISFVSLHEGIDTTTSNGRLMFGIVASFAEFEREIIRERVRSGLASARSRGVRLGQKPTTADPAVARQLKTQGLSVRAIASQLNVSVGTAHKLSQTQSGA